MRALLAALRLKRVVPGVLAEGAWVWVPGGLRLLRGNPLAALARRPASPDSVSRLRRLFAGYACAL